MATREEETLALCRAVLNINSVSEYDPGGPDYSYCPMCYNKCGIHEDMKDITHNQDCPYLIAKDLSTGLL